MRTLMIGRIPSMRLHSVIGVSIVCLLIMSVAQAATWEIVFYQQVLGPPTNLYDDYSVYGAGTFEIADHAIIPGNTVLFEHSEFLSFDVEIETDEDAPRQFTLGIDDFPPIPPNNFSQGILFDDNAQPLRFDTPATVTGNGARICEPTCDIRVGLNARLTLFDSDSFDLWYVISDGTIGDSIYMMLNHPGEPIKRLGGAYTYAVGVEIGGSGIQKQGYYEILTPPPLCAADINVDGFVNFGDLALLKANFFTTCSTLPPGTECVGDTNDDGFVNFGDLALMKSEFFRDNCPIP